jgi:tetratricopeptide (TPR) repeat protein
MPFNYRSLNPERMTVESYERLYESINTSRLIAFVGSGLSLVYGNYTWTEFVEQMIALLKKHLKNRKNPRSSAAESDALSRAKALIAAIEKDPSKDGIIVLELVRQAYELIDQLNNFEPDTSYREALKSIFDGTESFEHTTLMKRLKLADPDRARQDGGHQKVNGSDLYNLACLTELAEGSKGLAEVTANLREEPALRGSSSRQLPRDRRSLLSVFLAAAVMRGEDLGAIVTKTRKVRPPAPRPLLDPLRELYDDLAVRRFFTTNYDFELEKLFMFADSSECDPATPLNLDRIKQLIGNPEFAAQEGNAIVRHRPDGVAVRSDVNDGSHTAPLVEFAIGNVESFINIFHHHGRIDLPGTIIAADGEYNRMYRAEGMNRRSLDQAYDLMLEGNPIVFVGSSVSEQELTRTLRHKVSNARSPGDTPVYLLKEAVGTPGDLLRDQLSYWTRLGVRVLHYGHFRRGLRYSLRGHLELLESVADNFALKRVLAHSQRKWKPLCEGPRKKGRPSPLDQDQLRKNFRLLFDLDFDRHIVAWLLSSEGLKLARWISEKTKAGDTRGDGKARERAAGLIADYLRMLGEKLHTAALRHELRQIGREAKLFYKRKAKIPEAREVVPTPRNGLWTRHLTVPREPDQSAGAVTATWIWTTLKLKSGGREWDDSDRSGPKNAGELVTHLLARQKKGESPPAWTRRIVIGERGSAKGALLRQLVDGLERVEGTKGLIVNLCYGHEADSVVSLIRDYLVPDKAPGLSRREHLLEFARCSNDQPPPLIVLAAVDRLFGTNNLPLGAEFEWLLDFLMSPDVPLTLVIIGSSRCESYLRRQSSSRGNAQAAFEFTRIEAHSPAHAENENVQAANENPTRPSDTNDADDPDAVSEVRRQLGAGYLAILDAQALAREKDWVREDTAHSRVRMTHGTRLLEFVVGREIDALRSGPSPTRRGLAPAQIGRLAQEILKTTAFIGLPVEPEVLLTAPSIKRELDRIYPAKPRTPDTRLKAAHLRPACGLLQSKRVGRAFREAIDLAVSRQLLMTVEPYPLLGSSESALDPDEKHKVADTIGRGSRFVLHRAVSQVIRDRFGVPLGETVLSDSFSLSLYSSQTDDAPVTDPGVASEIDELLGHLLHAWKDTVLDSRAADSLRRVRKILLDEDVYSCHPLAPDLLIRLQWFEKKIRLLDPVVPCSLRAASGVIRGFFSSVNLLGLDLGTVRRGPASSAVITNHRRRIRQLLDLAGESQRVRVAWEKEEGYWAAIFTLRPLVTDEEDRIERRRLKVENLPLFDAVGKAAGASAVGKAWSEVEQLVATVEARRRNHAEPPLVTPLWQHVVPESVKDKDPYSLKVRPLYDEEIVWLLNERGMLALAQGDLYSAATGFALALNANARNEGHRYHANRCRLLVNRALLWIERGKIADARRCLIDLKQNLGVTRDATQKNSNEGRLIEALANGYVGLCEQLNGRLDTALMNYDGALKALREMRQQRAIAIFEFHRASLLQTLPGQRDQAEAGLVRAVAAAEGGRHTDILYRIRIADAYYRTTAPDNRAKKPGEALAVLGAARAYGEEFDMHRVVVDALSSSAQVRLEAGDVEAAAEDCKRAMGLAAQYGMTLRRIWLRVMTGRIYMGRNDQSNARFMFERAIEAADHIGYYRAVERANEQLLKLGRA